MVYFTCDACGEQLKKPSVEKHYTQKCRDCYKLTCIDCLKVIRGNIFSRLVSHQHFLVWQDFYGEEYQSHTSCMSEDQRYSKEGRGGWDPSKGQVSNAETEKVVEMVNMTISVFLGTQGRE